MNDNNDQIIDQENGQPCCDGGSCRSSGSDGSGKSWKMFVFILIVIAAGAVMARSFIRKSNSDGDQSQQAFASIQTDNNTIKTAVIIEKVSQLFFLIFNVEYSYHTISDIPHLSIHNTLFFRGQ